jgi:hypothetical protein
MLCNKNTRESVVIYINKETHNAYFFSLVAMKTTNISAAYIKAHWKCREVLQTGGENAEGEIQRGQKNEEII